MRDIAGSSLRRAAAAACLMLALASPSFAQLSPPPLAQPPSSRQFMSRFDFHLFADALASGDPRFKWDTHFGGDFDFVDYVRGRVTFLADYQAVLGDEIREFDPNQGNYTLEAATSARFTPFEVFLVLHHVSRHFGDRPKQIPIAWNVLQARVLKRVERGPTLVDLRADIGKVVAHATVDYSWAADVDVTVRRQMSRRASIYGRGYFETYGINNSLSARSNQIGGRAEGGVRFPGAGGALELFAGAERVIDADPIEQKPLGWAFAGFRLVGN